MPDWVWALVCLMSVTVTAVVVGLMAWGKRTDL